MSANAHSITATKIFWSAFICIHLGIALFMNAPERLHKTIDNNTLNGLTVPEQLLVNAIVYRIRYYAFVVGIDNRWQMFGRQSRFNWKFRIFGLYSDGHRVVEHLMPDPRQMERNVVQNRLWDFKEGKYHLNLYSSENERMGYAFFLARQAPVYDGLPIRSVAYERQWINILPPEVAQQSGYHLENRVNKEVINLWHVGEFVQSQQAVQK